MGTGFMGRAHLEALRRIECDRDRCYRGTQRAAAEKLASAFGVSRNSPSNYQDPSLDPRLSRPSTFARRNAQHYPMAKAALDSRASMSSAKKPLAAERPTKARELAVLAARKNLRNCVCRQSCAITRWSSRCAPAVYGRRSWRAFSSCRVPICKTGCSMKQTGTGASHSERRAAVTLHGRCWIPLVRYGRACERPARSSQPACADLQTFHTTRKQPRGPGRDLSTDGLAQEALDTLASIPRTSARSSFAWQRARARRHMDREPGSAGRKNRLSIEVSGTGAGVAWGQERPDELWDRTSRWPQRNHDQGPVVRWSRRRRAFADLPAATARRTTIRSSRSSAASMPLSQSGK